MFRRMFFPFVLTCVINSDLIMTSQISLGRLFPASRNRQRASSLISHAIESSFFKRPSFQPPKTKSKGTIKSLPSFPDVFWKFNKKITNNNVLKIQNPSEYSLPTEAPDLAEHFSKFSNFASAMMVKNGHSKLKGPPRPPLLVNEVMAESQRNEVRQKINKINEEEMKMEKLFSTRGTSTQAQMDPYKKKVETKFAGVTNSPIFYIQLPAAPYEFHPSLGYISRPASPDLSSFLRPQIDFLNNGRPINIFLPATQIPISHASDVLLDLTTATIMSSASSPITEVPAIMKNITVPTLENSTTMAPSSTIFSTSPSTTSLSISVSPSSEATSTITSTSTSRPTIMSSTTEIMTSSSVASESIAVESSPLSSSTLPTLDTTNNFTTTTAKPPTTIKGGHTNSPITWLKGAYFFNGRPNNIFIYKSPPNKADRFAYLHKLYSKPGVYL